MQNTHINQTYYFILRRKSRIYFQGYIKSRARTSELFFLQYVTTSNYVFCCLLSKYYVYRSICAYVAINTSVSELTNKENNFYTSFFLQRRNPGQDFLPLPLLFLRLYLVIFFVLSPGWQDVFSLSHTLSFFTRLKNTKYLFLHYHFFRVFLSASSTTTSCFSSVYPVHVSVSEIEE